MGAPDSFPVRGIRELEPADCDLAEAMGCRIRLIARAARVDGALDMAVEPLLLPSWHLLASVEEEYNAVYLRCASSGDLSLFGKGAGALPTATAVLGDLIDLAQDNSVGWPVPQRCRSRGAECGAAPLAAPPLPARDRPAASRPRAPDRKPRAPCSGLTVQNRASRGEDIALHLGFMISPSSEERMLTVREAVARLARVERVPVPRGARVSGVGRVARPGRLPGRASAAGCDGGEHAPAARRARRARAPHGRAVSQSRRADGAARSVRIGARDRVAGSQGRVPVRQRGLLVGAAASLRPLRHDRHRSADRSARDLEHAGAVLVCDSGMQATALVFDALMAPGGHAVLMRQVYNKTRTYLEWLAARLGGSVTIVDDGDWRRSRRRSGPRRASCSRKRSPTRSCARRISTRLVRSSPRRGDGAGRAARASTRRSPRRGRSRRRCSIRASTSCVGSGTKALGGTDSDLWGYIATRDTPFANAVMDLLAMRGGILDWRRATAILSRLDGADERARAPIGDGLAHRGVSRVASRR